MTVTVGLDVGGAHLKVARLEDGELVAVSQFVCPLWKGFENLARALAAAMPLLAGARRIAVTMTGELSDLFDSRQDGVNRIVDALSQGFGDKALYYQGPGRFASAETAKMQPETVGSMNFLATAELVSRRRRDALVIDFGSTTTDVIAVKDGAPSIQGRSDLARQGTGELVYTGYTRTQVIAVAQEAPLQGRWVSLAREYLATMADVRRVIGIELDGIDHHATADGRGRSRAESFTRLARMFGADAEALSDEAWVGAARYLRERQLRSIADGCFLVLSANSLAATAPIVSAGIGAGELTSVAARLGRPSESFGAVIGASGALAAAAGDHAPAVAVAVLGHGWGQT